MRCTRPPRREVDHCMIGLCATTPRGALDEIRQIGADVLPLFR